MKTNWPNRILNYTVTPPDGAWEAISNLLNQEENDGVTVRAELKDYEVAPPSTAFTNIFDTLDKEDATTPALTVSQKMEQYTHEPPAAAWQNINAALDEVTTDNIIPFKNKKNKLRIIYRIAAAAVLLTVLLITFLLPAKKQPDQINSVAAKNPDDIPALPPSDTTKTTNLQAVNPAAVNNNTVSTHTKSGSPGLLYTLPENTEFIKGNEVADLAADPRKLKKEKLTNANGQTPVDIGLLSTPNTYISITGPDGQSVKISSKFSSLLDYLKEQNPETIENIDIIIKESAQWRATFSAWRSKMTNNTVAPSLENFMDIIELSKVLEDKK